MRVSLPALSILALLVPARSFGDDPAASLPRDSEVSEIVALVHASRPGGATIEDLRAVRRAAESAGAAVVSVIPPSALRVRGSHASFEILAAHPLVSAVQAGPVDPRSREVFDLAGPPGGGAAAPFRDEVLPTAPDPIEARWLEAFARDRWDRQGPSIRAEALRRLGFAASPGGGGEAGTSGPFGKAWGAGRLDTSLYLAGDIAVGYFFLPGDDGPWATADIEEVFAGCVTAIDRFAIDEPNARISFIHAKEIDGEIPRPVPLDLWEYANDLRASLETHWAFAVIIENGPGLARAGYFGPALHLYRDDLRDGYTARHETCHIFGAADQYEKKGLKAGERWGYLMVPNGNTEYYDARGYFDGRGEALPDLMIDGWGISNPLGVFTRRQIGWRDEDGDGIPDPLDTFPDTVIDEPAGSGPPWTFTGTARERPLPFGGSVFGYPAGTYGDVSINAIVSVEYRVKNLPWLPAVPADVAFDSGEERFSFAVPELPDGDYAIECRAANSAGNIEMVPARRILRVRGGAAGGAAPVARLVVVPRQGGPGTDFRLDASASEDLEDGTGLEYRWDIGADGSWDVGWTREPASSVRLDAPGLSPVILEVRDGSGKTASARADALVGPSDFPPSASFTVSPAIAHGEAGLAVRFDAGASWDAETPAGSLLFRWDWDDDGAWDGDWSAVAAAEHVYLPDPDPALAARSRRWRARLEVLDAGGNRSSCVRDIAVIPYDRAPSPARTSTGASRISFALRSSWAAADVLNVRGAGPIVLASVGAEGLSILDARDPDRIVPISSLALDGRVHDAVISGSLAVIAAGTAGLHVVDLTDPAQPDLLGSTALAGDCRAVAVRDGSAIVAAGEEGLHVVDIRDPRKPVRTCSLAFDGFTMGISIAGSRAYLACGRRGLRIVDLSPQGAPALLGRFDSPGEGLGVFAEGGFAYLADGFDGVLAIDPLDPARPCTRALFNESSSRIIVRGQYAFVSCGDRLVAVNLLTLKSSALYAAGEFLAPGTISGIDIGEDSAFLAVPGTGILRVEIRAEVEFAFEADDPDLGTTWDGLVEARWDWEGDGSWDTPFRPDRATFAPWPWYPDDRPTPVPICEVRDLFGATARAGAPDPTPFLRGDADGDGEVTVCDPLVVLFHLFRGEALPSHPGADANDDGAIDLADPLRLLEFLFLGGPTLPPPYPYPGRDP